MRRGLALFLLCLAWVSAPSAQAETMHGVVIVVVDGDTVLFKPDHAHTSGRTFLKVRLAGIDAPETDQPYGDAATRALAARVLNRRVAVTSVATDVYGRTIAHIQVAGHEVGTELVQSGFAWAAARSRHTAKLAVAQRQARLDQRGLWQGAAPVPPWEWRRTHPKGERNRF
ncbi:thermonuclease family protein [Thiobacillus sp. 0-1251]|uniref:thermonuclease family protein n=1 Tax=Thiobacillus sp. 0-1251 TaxID=1895858 RepID=UPI000A4081CD|nr:thermonuclease family protein [Thiobacillus sp. 0-1251]